MKAENVQPASAVDGLRRGERSTAINREQALDAQRSTQNDIRELFDKYVVPTYARFDLALERGEGSYVWDVSGRRYLDFGGGIAVCVLGHANPEITDALAEQSRKLVHVSNLYYTEPQARLAKRIVDLIAPGRVFFCNSGAEANEGLFKNNLEAMRAAITESTAAILIEAIQGESGITIATREYLLGLRELCDQRDLLLLLDEVQAGQFRTGRFHSWQTIVDAASTFLPDGISIAKGLGGGFPIGAFWVREKFAALLSAGTHASTFGGTPLACAVALRILDVIERGDLGANARSIGKFLLDRLQDVQRKYPNVLRDVRGSGLMIGIEFNPKIAAIETVKRLHEKNLLTIPAATSVIRLLPPLNLRQSEANEGFRAIESVVVDLAKQV